MDHVHNVRNVLYSVHWSRDGRRDVYRCLCRDVAFLMPITKYFTIPFIKMVLTRVNFKFLDSFAHILFLYSNKYIIVIANM